MESKIIYEQLNELDKKILSISSIRQLDILSKYHEVDIENRIVTITIKLEKVSDVIVSKYSSKDKPMINSDFLSGLSEILHSVPEEFKLNFKIQFEDYEGYDPEVIMDSIQDSFEIFNYDLTKEKQTNTIKMAFLLFIGIFLFALLFYVCSFKFIDSEVAHNTIHEIVYTVACVLLWEGVYILFLPDNSYNSINEKILVRINKFILADKDGKELFAKDLKEMKKHWIFDTKSSKRAKRFLLIAGTGSMCFGAIIATDIIELTKAISQYPLYSILSIVLTIAVGLFIFISGLSAVCYYTNNGKLKNYLFPLLLISLSISVVSFGMRLASIFIYKQQGSSIYSVILTGVVIALIVGTLVSRNSLNKLNKEYLSRYQK